MQTRNLSGFVRQILFLTLGTLFIIFAVKITKISEDEDENLLEERICLTPSGTKEGLYSTAYRMAPYVAKYGIENVRLLSVPNIHGYRINEVLGIPPCSSDDESLVRKVQIQKQCTLIPSMALCGPIEYLGLNETSAMVQKILSIPDCSSYPESETFDILIHERVGDMGVLTEYGLRPPKMVWRNDTAAAINGVRRKLRKKHLRVRIYNEDEPDAMVVTRDTNLTVMGGFDVKKTLRDVRCALYGLVGSGGFSRFITDSHKVKNIICHSSESCEYFEGQKSIGDEEWKNKNIVPIENL